MADTRTQPNHKSCASRTWALCSSRPRAGRARRCGEVAIGPVIFLAGGWRIQFGDAARPIGSASRS